MKKIFLSVFGGLFVLILFSLHISLSYAADKAIRVDKEHIQLSENNKIYTLDKDSGDFYWNEDDNDCKEYIKLSIGKESGTLYHNGDDLENGVCDPDGYDTRDLDITDERPAPPPPCKQWNKDASGKPTSCASFDTGLGAISTDAAGFIGKVFAVLLASSGAIALLLIIRAGYKIMTSRGNPEAIKEGREQLVSAIVGLLFLIFSFILLELIGVDILKIPGLGGNPFLIPVTGPR